MANYFYCLHCDSDEFNYVIIDHESVCENCGIVNFEFQEYIQGWEELGECKSYFNNIRYHSDSMNYFKRIITCIQAKQKVVIPEEILNILRNNLAVCKVPATVEKVRIFLTLNQLQKYHQDVYLIVNFLNRNNTDVRNPFLLPNDLIFDLTFIFKRFLTDYRSQKLKRNKVKIPPLKFTCRIILILIRDYAIYKNLNLTYKVSDYLERFETMKDLKSGIRNEIIIRELLNEELFSFLIYKYPK